MIPFTNNPVFERRITLTIYFRVWILYLKLNYLPNCNIEDSLNPFNAAADRVILLQIGGVSVSSI